MAHITQHDQRRVRDRPGKVVGVLTRDELIALAVHDHDRYAERGQVVRGAVGLRPHPEGHRVDECLYAACSSRLHASSQRRHVSAQMRWCS
jgi:hypothetical protein